MSIRRRAFVAGMPISPFGIAGCASGPAGPTGDPDVGADRWERLDEFLRMRADEQAFSGAVLVAKDGEAQLEAGYGMADLGHNGGTPGYEGQLDAYPETGFVVAVLTNQDQARGPAMERSEEILTQ